MFIEVWTLSFLSAVFSALLSAVSPLRPAYSTALENALRNELFVDRNYSLLQRPSQQVDVRVSLTLLTVNELVSDGYKAFGYYIWMRPLQAVSVLMGKRLKPIKSRYLPWQRFDQLCTYIITNIEEFQSHLQLDRFSFIISQIEANADFIIVCFIFLLHTISVTHNISATNNNSKPLLYSGFNN